ncbi:MAG: hypothetical protein QTN59_19500 [Candidatus Electrothrix communis]|nr:MAG: hypothetical protein QTN59_19500 [Candidatus Electrothrix communis]
MTEKVGTIKNPLTIIAIFAAISEISGTIVLPFINAEHQGLYIWFLMIFPIILVVTFFLTLNFNHKVLYAPSDYKDEENFNLNALPRKIDQDSIAYQNFAIAGGSKFLDKITVTLVHGSKKKELPLEMRRSDFTRPEIFGRIGMLPLKEKGRRFQLSYISTPEFLQQLNRIRENDGEAALVIPCTEEEFSQFDLSET